MGHTMVSATFNSLFSDPLDLAKRKVTLQYDYVLAFYTVLNVTKIYK